MFILFCYTDEYHEFFEKVAVITEERHIKPQMTQLKEQHPKGFLHILVYTCLPNVLIDLNEEAYKEYKRER